MDSEQSERPFDSDESSPKPDRPWDAGAVSALLREVQSTHLFVWTMNVAGILRPEEVSLGDIVHRIRMAGRVVESNPREAMNMLQAASQSFQVATQQWTTKSRQSEERLRAARAVNRLNEATAKHHEVRTRLVPLQSLFRRAVQSVADYSGK